MEKTNVRLHPCDSELGSNPYAQDWFFEYGCKGISYQLIDLHIHYTFTNTGSHKTSL